MIFGENYIIKNKFYKDKTPINMDEVDIRRIVLSSKHSYGNNDSFDYIFRYIHKGKAFPESLCIRLPQVNGYIK